MSSETIELHSELEAHWFELQQRNEQLTSLTPEQLEPAFEGEPGIVTCIDEGTGSGDVRLAGSGILLPGGIEAAVKLLREQHVHEITSHENCGAAGIAYRKEHGLSEDAEVPQKDIDAYGAAWSQRLAKELGVQYRNISAVEMSRPPDFHLAGAVVVDTVGNMQADKVAELGQNFGVSAVGMDKRLVLSQVELSKQIAMDKKHGFGDRFSADTPFRIIIIGDGRPDIERDLEVFAQGQQQRVSVMKLATPERELV